MSMNLLKAESPNEKQRREGKKWQRSELGKEATTSLHDFTHSKGVLRQLYIAKILARIVPR